MSQILFEDRSVENWLNRLKLSTAKMVREHLSLFTRWLRTSNTIFSDYTPNQLLEFQRNVDGKHNYN
ncbi:MAG: hypothetical protein QG670_2408 [Thermoproteota archaeon]|nr:hypothetical protein [Thermoproteota archaeon]